jgi:hypothetical protein
MCLKYIGWLFVDESGGNEKKNGEIVWKTQILLIHTFSDYSVKLSCGAKHENFLLWTNNKSLGQKYGY